MMGYMVNTLNEAQDKYPDFELKIFDDSFGPSW